MKNFAFYSLCLQINCCGNWQTAGNRFLLRSVNLPYIYKNNRLSFILSRCFPSSLYVILFS